MTKVKFDHGPGEVLLDQNGVKNSCHFSSTAPHTAQTLAKKYLLPFPICGAYRKRKQVLFCTYIGRNEKMKNIEDLAYVIKVLKEDPLLKESFLKILEYGASNQQVRVHQMIQEIEKQSPPLEVLQLFKLLQNDKVAAVIRAELES